ncbi:MAG: DegV family protein [Eubacteriales bacterium]|nr:DegV family protein [Eubacteriales bacterium]
MSIRFITDSTTDLSPAIAGRVKVIPMAVHFGDETYLDGVDITIEQFYEKLTTSSVMPTTSQVAPATFADAFREAVEAGDEVVCLTISSTLSGTCQSANIAAAEFPGKVFVVDSRTVIMAAGILVEYGFRLAEQGLSAEQIAQALTQQRDRVKIVAVADTLEYLKRGGRISPTVAFAGGLLNIKPIICVTDGEIKLLNKARGAKQINAMLEKGVEHFGGIDYTMPIMFGYTGTDDELLRRFMEEDAALWAQYRGERTVSIIGSTVGTHVGPGAAAIAFFAK